jgi:hypothetical protein
MMCFPNGNHTMHTEITFEHWDMWQNVVILTLAVLDNP